MSETTVAAGSTLSETVAPIRTLPWSAYRSVKLRFKRNALAGLARLHAEHGRTVVFRRPDKSAAKDAVLFTTDPVLARMVLLDNTHFRGPSMSRRGPSATPQRRTRRNLFRMYGAAHNHHRRITNRPTNAREVEAYAPLMVERVQAHLERWQVGGRIDIHARMDAFMQDLSASILFGRDDPAETDALRELLNAWTQAQANVWVPLLRMNWAGTPRGRMLSLAERLEQRVLEQMARCRAQGLDSNTLLSGLLRSVDHFGGAADRELVPHVHTLFFAGHATSSSTLTWALFLLAQHPQVAHALRDELAGRLSGDPAGPESLADLPLLGRVVDEVLRMMPAVPYIRHSVVEDTLVHTVPLASRSGAYVSLFTMHHDPHFFAEPQRFDPQRWERSVPRPGTYLPFGSGPHICVGRWFALLNVKIALSVMLQRFTLRIVPQARVDSRVRIALMPRGPLPAEVLGPDATFERTPVRGNIHDLVQLT